MEEIRKEPCSSCPYRCDVPSGVWAYETYELLRPYDEPTGDQPFAPFACHATPHHLCHGWAVVHSERGREYELLALRARGYAAAEVPPPHVPMFTCGNEAADWGQRDCDNPSPEAKAMVDKLMSKYDRLREAN